MSRVPHRLATSLWTLGAPALVVLGTALWAQSVRSRLPVPPAVHWGPEGPDASGSLGELVVLPLAIIVPAMAALMWALGFFLGHAALTRRITAAVSVWTAVMLSATTATAVAVQLDVEH